MFWKVSKCAVCLNQFKREPQERDQLQRSGQAAAQTAATEHPKPVCGYQ